MKGLAIVGVLLLFITAVSFCAFLISRRHNRYVSVPHYPTKADTSLRRTQEQLDHLRSVLRHAFNLSQDTTSYRAQSMPDDLRQSLEAMFGSGQVLEITQDEVELGRELGRHEMLFSELLQARQTGFAPTDALDRDIQTYLGEYPPRRWSA